MNITFDLDLNGTRTLTENELRTDLEALRPELLRFDSPEGILHFDDPKRNVRFDLGDAIRALIYNLCFGPIAALAAGQPVEVEFFASEAKVRLAPEGDDVVFSWEGDQPHRLLRAEVLPALVACGERYVDFVTQLHGNDPDWSETLADLTDAAREARSRLPR